MFEVDVKTIPGGFGASPNVTLHFSPAAIKKFGQLPNFEMSKHDGSGMTWRIHLHIQSI
jgi:hypothetical protein